MRTSDRKNNREVPEIASGRFLPERAWREKQLQRKRAEAAGESIAHRAVGLEFPRRRCVMRNRPESQPLLLGAAGKQTEKGRRSKYGGGGHRAVGTCQFKDEEIEEKLPMLLDELVNYDKYYSATPV